MYKHKIFDVDRNNENIDIKYSYPTTLYVSGELTGASRHGVKLQLILQLIPASHHDVKLQCSGQCFLIVTVCGYRCA